MTQRKFLMLILRRLSVQTGVFWKTRVWAQMDIWLWVWISFFAMPLSSFETIWQRTGALNNNSCCQHHFNTSSISGYVQHITITLLDGFQSGCTLEKRQRKQNHFTTFHLDARGYFEIFCNQIVLEFSMRERKKIDPQWNVRTEISFRVLSCINYAHMHWWWEKKKSLKRYAWTVS